MKRVMPRVQLAKSGWERGVAVRFRRAVEKCEQQGVKAPSNESGDRFGCAFEQERFAVRHLGVGWGAGRLEQLKTTQGREQVRKQLFPVRRQRGFDAAISIFERRG